MDRFAAIQAFAATVEEGSFSAAARHLGLTASSVTRRIDVLEKDLGATLLNRSTRSVTLTAAGEEFYRQSRAILLDLESAEDAVRNLDAELRGRLRVVLPATFGRLQMMPIILDFMREHPAIRVQVLLSDTPVNLFDQDVDLAVRIGGLPSGDSLIATRLSSHRRRVVASPGYLKRNGTPREPADLKNHSALLFDYSANSTTWFFRRSGESLAVKLQATLCANDSLVLLQAVKQNLGVALLPEWLVADSLERGEVVALLSDYEADPHQDEVNIWILHPENRKKMRKAQALVEFLKRAYAGS